MLMADSLTLIVLLSFCLWRISEAFNCKFPNEGCDDSSECCSGKCIDAHPGTNPRCTKLGLHNTCLYTYQCEDRLRCGHKNKCCASYWGICSDAWDCCDPAHSCYEVEGFYYKRCLFPNTRGNVNAQCKICSLLIFTLNALALLLTWRR